MEDNKENSNVKNILNEESYKKNENIHNNDNNIVNHSQLIQIINILSSLSLDSSKSRVETIVDLFIKPHNLVFFLSKFDNELKAELMELIENEDSKNDIKTQGRVIVISNILDKMLEFLVKKGVLINKSKSSFMVKEDSISKIENLIKEKTKYKSNSSNKSNKSNSSNDSNINQSNNEKDKKHNDADEEKNKENRIIDFIVTKSNNIIYFLELIVLLLISSEALELFNEQIEEYNPDYEFTLDLIIENLTAFPAASIDNLHSNAKENYSSNIVSNYASNNNLLTFVQKTKLNKHHYTTSYKQEATCSINNNIYNNTNINNHDNHEINDDTKNQNNCFNSTNYNTELKQNKLIKDYEEKLYKESLQYENKILSLTSTITILEQENLHLKAKNQDQEKEIEHLHEENSQKQKLQHTILQENNNIYTLNQQLEFKVDEIKQMKIESQIKKEKYEEEILELKDKMDVLREKSMQLTSIAEENERLRSKIADLKSLENKASNAELLEKQIISLNRSLDKLGREKTELTVSNGKLEEKNTKLIYELEGLKVKIDDLVKENRDLKISLEMRSSCEDRINNNGLSMNKLFEVDGKSNTDTDDNKKDLEDNSRRGIINKKKLNVEIDYVISKNIDITVLSQNSREMDLDKMRIDDNIKDDTTDNTNKHNLKIDYNSNANSKNKFTFDNVTSLSPVSPIPDRTINLNDLDNTSPNILNNNKNTNYSNQFIVKLEEERNELKAKINELTLIIKEKDTKMSLLEKNNNSNNNSNNSNNIIECSVSSPSFTHSNKDKLEKITNNNINNASANDTDIVTDIKDKQFNRNLTFNKNDSSYNNDKEKESLIELVNQQQNQFNIEIELLTTVLYDISSKLIQSEGDYKKLLKAHDETCLLLNKANSVINSKEKDKGFFGLFTSNNSDKLKLSYLEKEKSKYNNYYS